MKKTTTKNVIVLGGAGYIGSHASHALADLGYTPIIVDNFCKGRKRLCGGFETINCDILDTAGLENIFATAKPCAVMHFAGLSEVGESVQKPALYYNNNTNGTACVLHAMKATSTNNLIFSSTAATYGLNDTGLFSEDTPVNPINPYGISKVNAENLIKESGIKALMLRYFNAAGAWPEKNIGELHDPETHLIPLILQTALGLRPDITVFGTDYNTKDGSCIRDYIHVRDIAAAHITGLEFLLDGGQTDFMNLGCAQGYSVLEIIENCKQITQTDFTVEYAPRRAGDPPVLIAVNNKIRDILGWQPAHDLNDIISSAWQWHKSLIT